MCGIYGIVGGAEVESPETLRRMGAAIVHRGPDDEGAYLGPGIALGMRRLSIIDLAAGHQPIPNEDGTIQVVCNGEIYNFRALRTTLEAEGHRFRTHSDTEVLVHLYEQHGIAFLGFLSGMFGLAIWDSRARRLVLARDRFGQKPLYYTFLNGRLAFASELKALLTLPGVGRDIDRAALREHLSLGYAVAPATLLAGIRKLPPAHCLVYENGAARVERYWDLPTATEQRTDGEWAELVRDELERAVHEHMVSDVPIGAFLSGGIDSSAVVALMARHSDQPVNTYSIGYEGGATESYYNELDYAQQVASLFGTRHHEIRVAPNVAELLPRLLWHVEEPIADSAMATTFLVSQLAAQSVKVILSGVGGDELFGGYRRYLGEHYGRSYARLPRWVRRAVVSPIVEALPSGRQSRFMDLARYAKSFVRADGLPWHEQYRLFLAVCDRRRLTSLLGDELPSAPDGFDLAGAKEHAADALLRLFRLDSQTQLPEDLLLLTDKVTMSQSIECRVPFLDHRLAELAARIPSTAKMPGGNLKFVLKNALRGVLPDSILDRGKRGFGAPVGAWFKKDLLPMRHALLGRQSVEARGLVAWGPMNAMLSLHDAGREDYTDALLALVNLEIWARIFIDRRSPADVSAELADRAHAA